MSENAEDGYRKSVKNEIDENKPPFGFKSALSDLKLHSLRNSVDGSRILRKKGYGRLKASDREFCVMCKQVYKFNFSSAPKFSRKSRVAKQRARRRHQSNMSIRIKGY